MVRRSFARKLFCFLGIITSIPCYHRSKEYPVCNDTSKNHLSNSQSKGSLQLALKCPKCNPDLPEDVYSLIFCHPLIYSSVVTLEEIGSRCRIPSGIAKYGAIFFNYRVYIWGVNLACPLVFLFHMLY
jgi:hypothetical protein